ncbi:hypothetical protein [Novosphingobium beihaiensis]|uniref:Uncharacterized protein n=1 Tax=Novosphingobium beihaiensis TaxID=2930389 RepID=A0ABT0BRY8_9SPHN|nr:hypothetical protein [Novosphingobium beihaiensis]MCJ2187561.1 hypothetical protein [Novosphingobium beihaiensis]
MFEWLILLAAMIGALAILISFEDIRQHAVQSGQTAASPLIGIIWVAAYNLIFWFTIARRASNVAKWLLVGLTAVGLVNQVWHYENYIALGPFYVVASIIASTIYLLSVATLFQRDSTEWLRSRGRKGQIDPEIFS